MLKFDEIIKVNGKPLTKKYIESLSKDERLSLVDPIFNQLRETGFIYMDDPGKIIKSYKRLIDHKPDISSTELFNNSSLATDICKYFCHSFYKATEVGKPNMIDIFNNDVKLKRIIENRLGLDWLEPDEKGPGVNESFNLSYKMIVFQGQRSMRMVNATSMFKPDIAKYMAERYSEPGDLIGDYSCGFGGRLLGAMSSNRRYRGTDPLTTPELEKMAKFFKFKDYELINSGSEDYRGDENSVDLYWSSPPYYNQEYYSDDLSQAYNKDEDYFYNVYWSKTMENVKYMLKPGKWFGLNILSKYEKMVDIAKSYFGEPAEIIKLKTIKSHLTRGSGVQKFEPIYMFKNVK